MGLGRTSALLLSLLVFTNLVTWSWKQHSSAIASTTFSKRDVSTEKCDNIYQYEDQCAYVLEHCQEATPGVINYIQLYYCASTVGKPVVFMVLCIWLLSLFGFVGIAASDFFCPNLQTIASMLHLSESLTGVTFLALGNGSPDLFSTFSAMNANMGSLALGELIGAASFIVSVIAGSMCAIKPFRAKRHSFLRDVSFFTLAILMVLLIVSDGLIHLYEAILLIVFYVIYVTTVVGGNYWMKKRSNYHNLVQRARSEYEETGEDVDHLILGDVWDDQQSDEMELYDEGFETEGYQDPSQHMKLRIRSSLFSAIEFQDVVKSLQQSTHRRHGLRQRRPRRRPASLAPSEHDMTVPLALRHDHLEDTSDSLIQLGTPTSWRQRFRRRFSFSWHEDWTYHLFPSLYNFDEKSAFNKLSSVISAPMILLLVVTLPVVKDAEGAANDQRVALNDDTLGILEDLPLEEDDDDDGVVVGGRQHGQGGSGETVVATLLLSNQWCRWLTAVQLVGASVLVGLVMAMNISVWILPLMTGVGAVMCLLFLITTSPRQRPRLYWMMCFVGFGMAVIWIYIIANEVVSVLQAIGLALGVSEAILGLTVFAVGNSLGDFVANITMARMGYPLMAMSACFGGPMLNIMLGIGLGATYVTCQRQTPYPIDMPVTIMVSSLGLLIVLISSLVLVPLNDYRMSRWFGYAWISIYFITMIINLILEFRSSS